MYVLLCFFLTITVLSFGSACPIVQRDFASGDDLTDFETDLANSFDDDVFNPATSIRLAKVNSKGSSINSPVVGGLNRRPIGYLASLNKNEKSDEPHKGEEGWPSFKIPDLPPWPRCNADEEALCCAGYFDEGQHKVFDCIKHSGFNERCWQQHHLYCCQKSSSCPIRINTHEYPNENCRRSEYKSW